MNGFVIHYKVIERYNRVIERVKNGTDRAVTMASSLIHLTPTEFIAFGFYAVPFFRAVRGYDMEQGVGFVASVPVNGMTIWKLILYVILLANAVHFHLSNWDVDEDDSFLTFKWKGIDGLAAPSTRWKWIEWSLRIFGLLCIYVMPLTLINGRGWGIEFVVVGLYLSVFSWDCIVAKRIGMKFGKMLRRAYTKPEKRVPTAEPVPETGEPEDPLREFKFKVNLWFIMEGLGLLLSIAYLVIAFYSYMNPYSFTAGLAIIVFLYGLILLIEACAIDWRRYWGRLIWCGIFMVILFYVVSVVNQTRCLGGKCKGETLA